MADDERSAFDVYIESLAAEQELVDEALATHLGWLAKDAAEALVRLKDDPRSAVLLVHALSTAVQELDTEAGIAQALHEQASDARRVARQFDD
jgi:hypothetical protein